jgi:3-methylcrotonyl-CoA carboxylase alpha subunit
MSRPLTRLLIANRGEIACRIIQTARRMGIVTIAVYSEADAGARYTRMADMAIAIGPAEARSSYLCSEKILAAAAESKADAIHPGYGFLSENADFAEAVEKAGLIFVGPPSTAIRAMGNKANAKQLMAKVGGPLLPGYDGDDQSLAVFRNAAEKTGLPVILKPAAGGGGKGMKVVRDLASLSELLASGQREAKASFGDDRIILERYLDQPRHVEVQIFADQHGNVVHLFERDCTLQRRHQKVVEEAPAPDLPAATRTTLHKAAIAAAKAVGYVSAGTVEFLIGTDGQPYFMEMNTRLQVEHPVTECITGFDLVEWQLRVAGGEQLPATQDQIVAKGHAFEARLYAEDPATGYLPQTGTLRHLAFPKNVRVDTGVESGDSITIHYDPMIAKIIARGDNRAEALATLAAALDATEVVGLTTNRDFLRRLSRHAVFRKGPPDIGWLDREGEAIATAPKPASSTALPAAARLWLAREIAEGRSGWRLNQSAQRRVWLEDEAGTVHTLIPETSDTPLPHGLLLKDSVHVFESGEHYAFTLIDPLAQFGSETEKEHHLRAPMPGRITAVPVKDGQKVSRGTPLMVLEAMKMEHTLRAPCDGTVQAVRFAVGDQVAEGVELVEWEPEAAKP